MEFHQTHNANEDTIAKRAFKYYAVATMCHVCTCTPLYDNNRPMSMGLGRAACMSVDWTEQSYGQPVARLPLVTVLSLLD